MTSAELRLFREIWPKLAEIFSATSTSTQGGGTGGFEGGDDDGPESGGGFLVGIQTEQGQNILTEGGLVIQAENQ